MIAINRCHPIVDVAFGGVVASRAAIADHSVALMFDDHKIASKVVRACPHRRDFV